MITALIPTASITDISQEVICENKKLKLFDSSHWKSYEWNVFRMFCHVYGRYGIPTNEMISFLREVINGRQTIEIGAGHGDLGFHLGIPMTDSKLQNRPEVKLEYMLMGQPTIDYPDDVEEAEAIIAVLKHKPQVVIGSWITAFGNPATHNYGCNLYGINEDILIDIPYVETYIVIGNIDQHGDKPIMKRKHDEYYFDWHVSRAKHQINNRIWIWNK